MFILKFLFWIFIIYTIARWAMRTFGGLILRAFQRTMLERMKEDMERQTRDYERNFDREPFRENVYQDQDAKVSAHINREKNKAKPKAIIRVIHLQNFSEPFLGKMHNFFLFG